MGGKLCCLNVWTKDRKGSCHDPAPPAVRSLALSDILMDLAPNIHLNRLTPQPPPQCLFTAALFMNLAQHLPPHLQGRKLELVYASWEHGFSHTAFKNCLTDRRTNPRAGVNKELILLIRPAVTLSAGDGTTEPVIGAFLPSGVDFSSKRYHGSEGSFVFTNIAVAQEAAASAAAAAAAGSPATSSASHPSNNHASRSYGTSSDSLSPHSPDNASMFSAAAAFHTYMCSAPKVNDYFVRATDGTVSIGGGGKGPAIAFTDDLDSVMSSVFCPTFGSSCLLPVDSNTDLGGMSPSGTVTEGQQCKAPIHTIEVWAVSNHAILFP